MDMGIIVPPIRIRDNMQLCHERLRGEAQRPGSWPRGVTYPEQFLAMDNWRRPRRRSPAARSPPSRRLATFPAYWITESGCPNAELMNYTVVEATAPWRRI